MITKITDENGVEHLVQGAGTVYNEERNSLAFGKGTSAIGQDQFVFGKYNIPDTDKVEIVGGGEDLTYLAILNNLKVGNSYTIDNPTSYDVISLTPNPYSIHFTPTSVIFRKIANGEANISAILASLYEASYIKANSIFYKWVAGKANIYAFVATFYGRNAEEITLDDMLFLTDDSGEDYWVAYKLGDLDYNGAVNVNVISQQTRANGLKHSVIKNIRTLDWSGNEVLKNSLDVNGVRIGNHPLHANSDYCTSYGFIDDANTPFFGIKKDGTFCVKYNDEIIELTPAKLAALIQTLNQ